MHAWSANVRYYGGGELIHHMPCRLKLFCRLKLHAHGWALKLVSLDVTLAKPFLTFGSQISRTKITVALAQSGRISDT